MNCVRGQKDYKIIDAMTILYIFKLYVKLY